MAPTVEKDPSPKILPKVNSSFLRDWGDLSKGVFERLVSPMLTSILRRWRRLEFSWVLTIDEEAQEHNIKLGLMGAALY